MKKPQTQSLQEQLVNSGLASVAKAKQVKAEKRKQNKQQRNSGTETANEFKREVEQMQLQQAERDRELNQLRQRADERKALQAQILSLIEKHKIAQEEDGMAFRFCDGNSVKSVFVGKSLREALSKGRAGIVRSGLGYEIVPVEIVCKIRDRDANFVVLLNDVMQKKPNQTVCIRNMKFRMT